MCDKKIEERKKTSNEILVCESLISGVIFIMHLLKSLITEITGYF